MAWPVDSHFTPESAAVYGRRGSRAARKVRREAMMRRWKALVERMTPWAAFMAGWSAHRVWSARRRWQRKQIGGAL